jgi:hypothetical protein
VAKAKMEQSKVTKPRQAEHEDGQKQEQEHNEGHTILAA